MSKDFQQEKPRFKAEQSKPTKKRRVNINHGVQLLFGDGNTVNHPVINYGTPLKEETPKENVINDATTSNSQEHTSNQGTAKGKEREIVPEDPKVGCNTFAAYWVKFIDNNESFHPYSAESHNVFRFGRQVTPHPNMDRKMYEDRLSNHESKTYEIPIVFQTYINNILNSETKSQYQKAIREVIQDEEEEYGSNFLESTFRAIYNLQTTTIYKNDDEATFNSLLNFPFLDAVASCLKDTENWTKQGSSMERRP